MENKKPKATKQTMAEDTRIRYSLAFGIDFKHRVIRISGPISDQIALESGELLAANNFHLVDAAMCEMEKSNSKKPITIKINSPGGSVYEALAIAGRMKASKCKVITEGYGHVMSAATILLAAGDERRISKYCISMFHQSSYGLSGSHEQIKEEVAHMEREEKLFARWMSELSTKSEEFWYRIVKKKNIYLDSEEMIEYGVIDSIIEENNGE